MYQVLLPLHSLFRWVVLIAIIYPLLRAVIGKVKNKKFTSFDNAIRHWSATLVHIQLMIGVLLYVKSPIISFFWQSDESDEEGFFFAIIHFLMMIFAVIAVTVGSAITKRKVVDDEKFETIIIWYSIAIAIILMGIPWPFSPFTVRPYVRPF